MELELLWQQQPSRNLILVSLQLFGPAWERNPLNPVNACHQSPQAFLPDTVLLQRLVLPYLPLDAVAELDPHTTSDVEDCQRAEGPD